VWEIGTARKKLLKDLWVKYGRCSTSIHLQWEQKPFSPIRFPEGRAKKKFQICSDDAILLCGGFEGLIKAKSLYKIFFNDKIIPI